MWIGATPAKCPLPGLVAFLAAHLCYIVGLNSAALELHWSAALLLGLGLTASIWIGRYLVRAIRSSPTNRPLLGPVLIYSTVLSLMLFSALLGQYREGWSVMAAALVGALAASHRRADGQPLGDVRAHPAAGPASPAAWSAGDAATSASP